MNKPVTILLFVLAFTGTCPAQQIYLPSQDGLDDLLDELSANHVISIHSGIKPWSRQSISLLLWEAESSDSLLNKRQKKEVSLFRKSYFPELILLTGDNSMMVKGRKGRLTVDFDPLNAGFHSKHAAICLRPLINGNLLINENGTVNSENFGLELFGYVGKHFGASFRFNKSFTSQILNDPMVFSTEPGNGWNKYTSGGGDAFEWQGQATGSWNWGMLGIFKERFAWGNQYHGSNIISGKTPSFPFIRLQIRPTAWFEFNYIQGWLSSGVIDSGRTFSENSDDETFYISKHIAANLLTITPWKYLDISFGNSIIYDGSFQPAYLIPFAFFKSIDHTLTGAGVIDNQNSQMFLDISSRQIKHLHVYLTLFIDEFMMSRVTEKDANNFLSWKLGAKLSDFPFQNLSLTIEGTRTLPMTYQHYTPTLTYESDDYSLGNYLRSNSQEVFVSIGYKPLAGLHCSISYNFAQHGDDFQYGQVEDPVHLPVLKNITWEDHCLAMKVMYQIVSNGTVYLCYQFRENTGDSKYTAPVFLGRTNSLFFGLQIGL